MVLFFFFFSGGGAFLFLCFFLFHKNKKASKKEEEKEKRRKKKKERTFWRKVKGRLPQTLPTSPPPNPPPPDQTGKQKKKNTSKKSFRALSSLSLVLKMKAPILCQIICSLQASIDSVRHHQAVSGWHLSSPQHPLIYAFGKQTMFSFSPI